jgi:hypothetical protein
MFSAQEALIERIDYLNERKQYQTLPLSLLSESRLGIDASHFLRGLLETPATREPLLAATGGLLLSLTSKIESDLRALENSETESSRVSGEC